jgi:glutamate-ammonia-ligase adenylyltransferase
MTLRNLTNLVSAQKLPDQFYSQLKDARFRKLILSICAISPRFVKGLSRNPLLLESIASDPHALAGARLVSPLPAESIHGLKNQEELRAGIRNVLGLTTFNELTAELSQLADIIVTAVFSNACDVRKTENPPLAVFALGKYGTRELTFDADLDILFVVDSSTNDMREQLENTASATLSSLSEVSEKGRLYDIDARLRPEGKSAPLIIDKPAYAKYLRERASLWERQSLTRARFVCGDESLANAVVNDVESFVYEEPLPASWVDTIVTMRRGMETHSRTRGSQFLDIKRGAGGMVDVEFLAQMVQLKFGREHNALRHGNTVDILTFKELPCLTTAEADSLAADYGFYRQIEKLLRITLEERTSILPDGEKTDLLARCLGGTTGDALVSRLGTTMKGVRSLFLDISNRIAKA